MKAKRFLAFLLTLAMVISFAPATVFADSPTYQLVAAGSVVLDGTEDKTVDVYFQSIGNESTYSVEANWSTSDLSETEPKYLTLTKLTPNGVVPMANDVKSGRVYFADTSFSNPIVTSAGGTIWTATYTVGKDTPAGTYTVSFTGKTTDQTFGENNFGTLTATITVEKAEKTSPFEIYYTLSGSSLTDSSDDAYTDYNIDDTVTATVFLKNNSGVDTYLQAYDLFLDYDDKLIYQGTTIAGAVKKDESGKVTHIQAVGEDSTKTAVLTEKEFRNGATVELGTISFTISEDAVYNIGMPISLIVGTSSKTVTNIGVGAKGTGAGDATSYYPAATSKVEGAEVKTTYTVTFETSGGSAIENQTIGYKEKATKPTDDPTKDNHTFKGWYSDENLTSEFNFDTPISENLTLYAKWEQNTFKVYWYNTDGTEIYNADVNAGGTASFDKTQHNEPTKTADAQYTYAFKGWSTSANPALNADVVDLNTYKIEAETKFYPVFTTATKTYTVTWKNADGTELEKDEEVPYGAVPVYNGSDPTKESSAEYTYTFAGWTPEVAAITGNTEYTATFAETPRKYTVKFATEDNGTLTAADNQEIAYGTAITAYPTVTPNDGYSFDGWYAGDIKIDTNSYKVTGDVTLTAKYTAKTYTVTFNPNGGGGTMSNQTFTFGVAQKLTKNAFTAPIGYSFAGWNTVKDPTTENPGNVYVDEASFNLSSYAENVTLYAQWSANPYTVSVDSSIDSNQGSVTAANADGISGTSANVYDTIKVTVTPKPGYEIGTVTYTPEGGTPEEIIAADGTYSFTMPAANVTVKATFTAINYNVTVDNANISNGSVTAAPAPAHVGDEITLEPVAGAGYKWVSYTVTYTDNGETKTVTVTDNKFIMPAADVTVTATFVGIPYTVTFDKNAEDATGTVNDIDTAFGEDITLSSAQYSRTGYTFAGWATAPNASEAEYIAGGTIAGTNAIFTPTAEGQSVTLYAVWKVNSYTVTVTQPEHGTVDAGNSNRSYLEIVTLSNTPVAGYELDKYTVTDSNGAAVTVTKGDDGTYKFTMPASNVTVTASFKAIEYGIVKDNSDSSKGTVGTDLETATIGTTVTLSNTPVAGYELDKYTVADSNGVAVTVTKGDDGTYKFTMPASNVNVSASFRPVEYTITFETNGGTEIAVNESNGIKVANKMTYNIESTYTLPATTKTNYSFAGWKVTTADGNWEEGSTFNVSSFVTNMYGNVTLTAQWTTSLKCVVEEYKYAPADYRLLRIDASNLEGGMIYTYDGKPMYYTEDPNYAITPGDGVFYTLILATSNTLGETQISKIASAVGMRTTITYDGDINGDGVINIADANAVFQMVRETGSYYSLDQLSIAQRLAADMVRGTNNTEQRGSIEDVNAIVNIINGITP